MDWTTLTQASIPKAFNNPISKFYTSLVELSIFKRLSCPVKVLYVYPGFPPKYFTKHYCESPFFEGVLL